MSPVKLIWTSHPRFPLPPLAAAAPTSSTTPTKSLPPQPPLPSTLYISLLDSSFNPPTLAHLALASHPSPPSLPPFQAHILALSVKNVDKPGADAKSVELRLEMMRKMAEEMVRRASEEEGMGEEGPGLGNVGVVLLEEPTFVGKSSVVKEALDEWIRVLLKKEESDREAPNVRLTFVIGKLLRRSRATTPLNSFRNGVTDWAARSRPPRLGHPHPRFRSQVLSLSGLDAVHPLPLLRARGQQFLVRQAGGRPARGGAGIPGRGGGAAVGGERLD